MPSRPKTSPRQLWIGGLALVLWGTAAAQIPLEVRARAQFEQVHWQITGDTLHLAGTLRDDLGRPVPRARVQLAVDVTTTTDLHGRFQFDQPAPDTPRQFQVTFAGSRLLGPTEARVAFETGRRPLKVAVDLAERVPAQRPTTATVRASTAEREAPASGLTVRWRIGDALHQSTRLDRRGQAVLALAPLEPGPHRLEVLIDGDAQHQSARIHRAFTAARPLGVKATVEVLANSGLRVGGQVEPGPPGVRLTVLLDGEPAAQRRAEADGHFEARLPPLDPGPHTLRVLAHAADDQWLDGASAPVDFTITAPARTTPSWAWSAAALAAGVLAVLGGGLRRRAKPAVRPAAPPRPPPFTFEAASQAAPYTDLVLWVRDGLDEHALAAQVVVLPADGPPPLPGRLSPPGGEPRACPEAGLRLPAEPARLWVGAPGYAPAVVAARGAGQATVRLLPLRAAVQRQFDTLLELAGRPPLRFGRQTPRDAARQLVARGASADEARHLAAMVEAACFGANPPHEAEFIEFHQLAQRVGATLAGAS